MSQIWKYFKEQESFNLLAILYIEQDWLSDFDLLIGTSAYSFSLRSTYKLGFKSSKFMWKLIKYGIQHRKPLEVILLNKEFLMSRWKDEKCVTHWHLPLQVLVFIGKVCDLNKGILVTNKRCFRICGMQKIRFFFFLIR